MFLSQGQQAKKNRKSRWNWQLQENGNNGQGDEEGDGDDEMRDADGVAGHWPAGGVWMGEGGIRVQPRIYRQGANFEQTAYR
jgi:hypothetical protein